MLDKATDCAREFEKPCKTEGMEIYYTLSETKAALPERAKRSSRIILYDYM